MTVREAYAQMGANYDEAMGLMRKEERVAKYMGMFLRDESFAKLQAAMEADDMEAAFTAAHTLKGVCGNLAFTRLFTLMSDLTEDLRHGRDIPHAKAAWPAAAEGYRETVRVLKAFQEEAK